MNAERPEPSATTPAEPPEFALHGGWLRGLVEQTLAGIYIIQDGKFRYVNQGFADIFGYASPSEVTGTISIIDLVAPEDRERVTDNVRRRTSGETDGIRYGFTGLHRDGHRMQLEVHGRSMQIDNRPAVIGLILDVTERRLAEAASDEKLRALFTLSPHGIALIDRHGRHVEFNDTFLRLLGYPADTLEQLDFLSLIPAPFSAAVADLQASLAASGRCGPLELELRRADDTRLPVQLSGMQITGSDQQHYLWLIIQDISDRKGAELALQDSLRFARQLIEVIPNPVFYKDSEGRYLGCNEAFERFMARPRQVFIGKSVYDLSPRELADRYHAADKALLDSPGTQVYEAAVRAADGTMHDVIFHKATFAHADGQTAGLVGVILDITERKQMESRMAAQIAQLSSLNRKLEEAQTQLLQAEKMSAIGQLAAGVAHEINNPVGFVNSNLGTLRQYLASLLQLVDAYEAAVQGSPRETAAMQTLDRLKDDLELSFIREDSVALLDESRDGLERVKRIVADLKDFSRVGESDWQTTNLHQCLDSTLNVVASELKYKATVVRAYGELPEIRCMPFQLNQVFMNLLVNAAHAIPERGTITLRTGRADDTVWVEVEDTGTGISADNIKRIFDPFFTTKPVGKGTGLGLSVSYGIVQKHGGQLTVRSVPGEGSVFRVTLPISPPDTAAE